MFATHCLCELAAFYDVLWLIFASFCAPFGFSMVTSGCKVLQMDFCHFWWYFMPGQQILHIQQQLFGLVLLPHLFTVVLAAYP